MNTMPLDAAKQNLDAIVAGVLASAEPVVLDVVGGKSVVLMTLEDFSSWQETAYLLQSPANAAHLRKSLDDARNGRFVAGELDDQ